jgi:hypothetical protein
MTTPLWHTEPSRQESKPGRYIRFTWDVEKRDDGSILQAVLHVSHAKAGINYYTYERTAQDTITAGLRQQVFRPFAGGTVTEFTMFSGLRIHRWEAGNRFSFKTLRERADAALTVLRESADQHPSVAAYFAREVDA